MAVFILLGILTTHLLQLAISQHVSTRNLPHHAPRKQFMASTSESASNTIADEAAYVAQMPSDSESELSVESHSHHCDHHVHGFLYMNEATMAVIMLEVGVISHSVIVGLGLGVMAQGFIPLLIAISFHQFFEGLALSSMITASDLSFRTKIILGTVVCTLFSIKFYI